MTIPCPAHGMISVCSPYLFAARVRLALALAYRFEVAMRLATQGLIMCSLIFLWRAAYRGIGPVAGVDGHGMQTYAIMASVLGAVLVGGVTQRLQERINSGDVALDLIRPMTAPLLWLAEDLGEALGRLVLVGTPLLAAACALGHPPWPASAGAATLTIAAVVLAVLINWLLALLVGLGLFWWLDLGYFARIKDLAIRILAGGVLPLWLFPEWLQHAARLLPFTAIYQGPLELWIGRATGRAALGIIAMQVVWLAILALAAAWLWSRARRVVQVQGG